MVVNHTEDAKDPCGWNENAARPPAQDYGVRSRARCGDRAPVAGPSSGCSRSSRSQRHPPLGEARAAREPGKRRRERSIWGSVNEAIPPRFDYTGQAPRRISDPSQRPVGMQAQADAQAWRVAEARGLPSYPSMQV
ncbi:hypothetical protein [Thermosporothrix hazakensis]|uniref:hypothetical protein n=1 Tax=Thermosporothrix hazakensis TaxID=644383 RepID=UPI0010F7F3C3|nr:hypothetical protein [Thermosporothrix hazakensis]